MSPRRSLCALLALLLLWAAGCASSGGEQPEYVLYFTVSRETANGPALAAEPYVPEEGASGAPSPGDLVEALLAGPREEGHRSPFPRGVSLQGWEWDGERPGGLRIYLSEQYGGLTDISLTLADYAIVLTLSQLAGVETVEILSEGHTANYRSHQVLSADEAVLPWPPEGAQAT